MVDGVGEVEGTRGEGIYTGIGERVRDDAFTEVRLKMDVMSLV